ncbi:MAG: response regulator [bacterium]
MQSVPAVEPICVLVVDDDSALVRTLADILRLHGYAPCTAGTGHEGLALAVKRSPVLALIDLRLPDMSGTELASRLHALSELIQVVVLTGNATVESAVAALRERSVDYLVKPVDIEQLLQVASLATERWQRRDAEERLRESDERFRRIVESDMLGVVFWDTNGISETNGAFLKMIGCTREDIETGEMSLSGLTPPEYAELDSVKRREIAKRGVVTAYEKEFYTKSGNRVPVLVGGATLEGRHDCGVAFVLDITDRKLAERALEARVRQQAAVARFGQRAVVADDLTALCKAAAELVADTLELPVGSVFERRPNGLSLALRASVGWDIEPPSRSVMQTAARLRWRGAALPSAPVLTQGEADQTAVVAELLRSQGVVSGITVLIPGSGAAFGVLAAHDRQPRAFTQDDVHFLQAVAHILGTAIDRSRTELAFRQAQRLEAVGRLASGLSHDFNNMLTAISGFAELVRADLAPTDPHRGDMDEILTAASRAAGLTRQLLAFSRQQVLEPRIVSLNDVVVQMEKMLVVLIGPEIAFDMRLDPALGLVKADPGKIEQVILNLCVNARDAMPRGGTLTIETANAMPAQLASYQLSPELSGPCVMLAVTDTGTGMDADTQLRVFEPFFTTKSPDKGTGLGLATVYGIVKQSGGEIRLQSEPNCGACFQIFLPSLGQNP